MTSGISGAAISAYWDERAQSYSNGVEGELGDDRRTAWDSALGSLSRDVIARAAAEGRAARVLDLGCGPGFFSILLARRGCQVQAVDASENMLRCARMNARTAGVPGRVSFHLGDISALPFEDGTFDVAVARNVTWLMREPRATYAEWLRVLRPGGKLLVFDANWYRYLVDPAVAQARRADQEGNVLEGWGEDAQATSDEERRCEEIAAKLPLTPVLRPQWDLECLESLGAEARADEDVWKTVWSASEQSYYRATPMFLVEAVK